MKNLFRVLLGIVLAAAMVFLLSRTISWQDAKNSVQALSWGNIGLIVGAVMVISLVKATRFFFILRFGNVPASYLRTLRIFFASQAFTPMPGGEVGRAMLFKNGLDVHLKEVAGPVFLQALMELWTATLWVALTAFFVGYVLGWWLIGLLSLLAILTAPLIFSKHFPRFFEMLKSRGMKYAWIDKSQSTFQHFASLISSQGKTRVRLFWVLIVGLGLLAHALGGGLMWYIARTVGVHISLLQGIFAATVAILIQGILTVIPGGLGVTEGGLVGILSGFAIPWQKTIVITLLYRIATLPLIIAIAAIFLIFMYGKKLFNRPALKST